MDPARSVALDVLGAVSTGGAYANLALGVHLREAKLSGRDAAFATELVSGTLRRRGTYDAVLASVVDRPLPSLDVEVLDALRLGTHQLLGMRVPAHAAVSTTVALVSRRRGRGAGAFANAVLRRVSTADYDAWVTRVTPDPEEDPSGYAEVSHSHPRWVVEAFQEALGSDATELRDLLEADNVPAKVMMAARPGLSTVDELVAAGGTRSSMSPYAVALDSGAPGEIPAIASDRAGVQDEGSQLVVLALLDADVAGRDTRWLDLCAGPGGKSALLAALGAQRGARVLANEVQPHRATLVARSTAPSASLGRGVLGVVVGDGRRPPWRAESFDRVLLDAPCSGLGALRRRPEARWRRGLRDLDTLVPLQRALLGFALDAVRPGGVVAYVTCSPVLAETSAVVSAVLRERPDAVVEDASHLFPGVPGLRPHRMALPGTVQLWPHRQHTDAMFFALLRRVDGTAPGRPTEAARTPA